jgi:hypothetical protein
MTRTLDPDPPTEAGTTPDLDSFFEHVRYSNPFDVNRVGVSSTAREDAANVHHRQFVQLTELAAQAEKQHLGIGTMLWGEAGVGKSHLLARLGRWAGTDHRHAIFVYLSNLQAQPEQLPRSLLRCVVSILTGGRVSQFRGTPLFSLVNAAIRQALNDDGTQHSWRAAEAAYQRLIDDLCARSPGQAGVVDRQAYVVLFQFFRSAYLAQPGADDGLAARAARWLAGDYLDPEETRSLGIPVGPGHEPVALADDEQIKRVLIALAQVASYRQQPLILCFDQVDNLDPEQFRALASFLHALLDSACNLLVITSGVRSRILDWKKTGILQESTWDRLGQYEVGLQRVGVPEARQLVQVRLEQFLDPFLPLQPVKERVQQDYLFPLGEEWAKEFLATEVEIRPRDVINWAREGWRRQQDNLRQLGGPAWLQTWVGEGGGGEERDELTVEQLERLIDAKVDLKLREHEQQRQLEPQTLPPDGDNLAGLMHTLLQRCPNRPLFPSLVEVVRPQRPKYGQRPACDLLLRQRAGIDGAEVSTGLLCLVVSNRTSMAAYLRRLVQDPHPPRRLFLVTEERRPLDPAAAGREYLDKLRARHGEEFHQVDLTFADYAALDALQAVVGLARSGDLEIELSRGRSRRITEPEVIASHERRQRYLSHPLFRLLLTAAAPPPPPPPPPPVTDERDVREFIMGQLGMTMGCSSKELAVKYEAYLKTRQVVLTPEACKARVEEVARWLHQDGKLNATPLDDYLYLLLR